MVTTFSNVAQMGTLNGSVAFHTISPLGGAKRCNVVAADCSWQHHQLTKLPALHIFLIKCYIVVISVFAMQATLLFLVSCWKLDTGCIHKSSCSMSLVIGRARSQL